MTSRSLQCAAVTFAGLTVCGSAAIAGERVARGLSSGDAQYNDPESDYDPVSFIDGVSIIGAEDDRRLAGNGSFGSVGDLDAFGDRVISSVSMEITGLSSHIEGPAAASGVHLESDLEHDPGAFVSHRTTLQSKMNGLVPEPAVRAGTFHASPRRTLRNWRPVPVVDQPIPPDLQSRFTFPRSFRAR
jgi:hypothetical protein